LKESFLYQVVGILRSDGLEHCHDGPRLHSSVGGVVIAGKAPVVPTCTIVERVFLDLREDNEHVMAPFKVSCVLGVSVTYHETTTVAAMEGDVNSTLLCISGTFVSNEVVASFVHAREFKVSFNI